METLLLVAAFALLLLLGLRDNYNDDLMQQAYHRLEPAEDGCVHELAGQAFTLTIHPSHRMWDAGTEYEGGCRMCGCRSASILTKECEDLPF